MTRQQIIAKIKELNLPAGSYVVFGGAPLAVAGIRESNDIDLLVTRAVFEELKRTGWQTIDKGPKDKPITQGVFEAHYHWLFSGYSPTLDHLLKTGTTVDSIPFASLKEVRKWKAADGIPKHLADVKLIDNYLKNKT